MAAEQVVNVATSKGPSMRDGHPARRHAVGPDLVGARAGPTRRQGPARAAGPVVVELAGVAHQHLEHGHPDEVRVLAHVALAQRAGRVREGRLAGRGAARLVGRRRRLSRGGRRGRGPRSKSTTSSSSRPRRRRLAPTPTPTPAGRCATAAPCTSASGSRP